MAEADIKVPHKNYWSIQVCILYMMYIRYTYMIYIHNDIVGLIGFLFVYIMDQGANTWTYCILKNKNI